MTYIVEVQHSSDHNKDGKWFELDRANDEKTAAEMMRYFGVSDDACDVSGAYEGRPLRYHDGAGRFVYLDREGAGR